MTVSVTLVSENDLVLHLVSDFAHGLGCAVEREPTSSGRSIRIEVDDDDHSLVELLTHVALSAAKAGVDVTEPTCHVTSPAPRRHLRCDPHSSHRRVSDRHGSTNRRLRMWVACVSMGSSSALFEHSRE